MLLGGAASPAKVIHQTSTELGEGNGLRGGDV